ncbi:MAG TPA: hypothetical protein VHM23_27205, partial [Actinomycetota bacterium]|nr:hypothetical protein [Actinomycetota bacterium]
MAPPPPGLELGDPGRLAAGPDAPPRLPPPPAPGPAGPSPPAGQVRPATFVAAERAAGPPPAPTGPPRPEVGPPPPPAGGR